MPCNHCNTLGTPETTGPLKQCSRCKQAKYCSTECQTADWKLHKRVCRPEGTVRGIVMACDGETRQNNGLFNEIDLDPSHPIHTKGVVCPMSKKVGLSIVIYRHLQEDPLSMERTARLDNQRATYLMINPVDGFAPPEWQMCVGTVTVMRQDGKPLTRESIETIWMYHDHLLDLFGEGAPPYSQMTRQKFEKYCERYKEERLLNGYTSFQNMSVPL
ncbi:MYND-type domain-containing protein [Mycena indigotica]|uniref:MYND-type domain-containing protein n=1 Tax=Mycena indigotica TaxID=2126181 RepID=A0A8H6TF60_9AGAR|nr:MYND-type domain-containing protein [Mycena indigotica]KAF7316395.1 MYND-type domain-containing protein [Mycena indigotica]